MTATAKKSPEDANACERELDETSLSAIRSILTEEAAPTPRARSAGVVRETPGAGLPERAPVRRKADGLPTLEKVQEDQGGGKRSRPSMRAFLARARTPRAAKTPPKPPAEAQASRAGGRGAANLAGYRPKPAHIALAAFVLLVLMRPWLVLGFLFVGFFILAGVFLVLGYDGFWHGVMRVNRWYARRRPARAAIVLSRLDRFAMRWDAVLDRFPEGSVDGLYLPDFGSLATADRRHEEVLERRLSGLSGKGA
jgi:hypothetical protein